MDLRVTHGRVILPDVGTHARAAIVDELRAGTFDGTVRGTRVIGRDGIAAMIGVKTASLRRHLDAGVRSLPAAMFRLEHHGAVVYLYDLEAIRVWATQLGKLKGQP